MSADDFFEWDMVADNTQEYVPIDKNGVSRNGGEVYADDLGVCIGVGIYDESRNEGYLSHLGTVSRKKEDLMTQVNLFLESLPELENPTVVVTGGSYPSVTDDVDTDFGDSDLEDTYHIGGLKAAVTRIMEQEFDTQATFEQAGEQSKALYVNSDTGIRTESSELL